MLSERHGSGKLNVKKAHPFINNSRDVSWCSLNCLNQSLFGFTVCAVAALANADDPGDDQIYETSAARLTKTLGIYGRKLSEHKI